jgi:hypothetical protein
VFGDEDEERGGIKGGKGLLTPWSPGGSSFLSAGSAANLTLFQTDDTKDIKIPSIFVSRASYLSLIKTWQDEQRIVLGGHDSEERARIGYEIEENRNGEYVGLEVVLSKDEMFAW